MSDLLSSAIAAARARAEEGADDGAATRLRVRETLARRGGASRKRWTLLAAVIGTLFGSTAFALHQGYEPFASPMAVIESAVAPSTTTPADHVAAPKRARGNAPVQVAASEPASPIVVAPSTTDAQDAPAPLGVTPTAPRPEAPAPAPAPPVSVAAALPANASSIPAPDRRAGSAPLRTSRAPAPSRVATPAPTTSAGAADPEPASSARASSTPRIATEGPASGSLVEPAPSPSAPPASVAPEPDGELAAYRVAHNAHFRGADPVAALAAWDAYLAKFPTGRMALDARYDRALVLVKLQRWAAAREALAPFAAPSSTYRRAEASRLLEAIRTR